MQEPRDATTQMERASSPQKHGSDGESPALREPREAIADRVRALRLDKRTLLRRRPFRRWFLFLLFVTALGAGGYAAWPRLAKSRYLKPVPEVPALTVAEEPSVPLVLNTTGYIIAHTVVQVGSRVPGTIVELNMEEGALVQKGQLLARLEDLQYLAELNQAKAALAAAEAQLTEQENGSRPEDIQKAKSALVQAEAHRDLMNEEYARAKELQKTISKAEFARARSGFLEAQAAVEQAASTLKLVELGPRPERIEALAADVQSAKALVDKAQYHYDGTTILAPIDGKIVERNVEVGETLRAENLATSLCRIAEVARLEVEIDIPERDLAAIRLEQPCRIRTEAYPDRIYRGQLTWLAPMFNRQRAIRRAKISITNVDDQLAPDMNCQVQILAEEPPPNRETILRLPEAALRLRGNAKFVYTVENDTAHRRQVEVTEATDGMVEVQRGLTTGEVVLLPGTVAIQDGQSVRVRMVTAPRSG